MEKKGQIVLSKRLTAVAKMVTKGHVTADIGCDHGFVSIYLIQNNIAPKVFALDVNEGPLERAREHILQYNMEKYIFAKLSDGMEALSVQDYVETAIMAGMGGRLMQEIINHALERELRVEELILQPQSQWMELRVFLRQNKYHIMEEDMIFEDGKYYPIIRAQYDGEMTDIPKGVEEQTEDKDISQAIKDSFGPKLVEARNEILLQYLEKEANKFNNILCSLEVNQTKEDQSIKTEQEYVQKDCSKSYREIKEKTELLNQALEMMRK